MIMTMVSGIITSGEGHKTDFGLQDTPAMDLQDRNRIGFYVFKTGTMLSGPRVAKPRGE